MSMRAMQGAPAEQPERLGTVLVEKGLLQQRDLARAHRLQAERGGSLTRTLVDLGLVKPGDLLEVESAHFGLPLIHKEDFPGEPPPVSDIPPDYLRQFRMIPLALEGECLAVATSDPLDLESLASVKTLTGRSVKPVLATESDILAAIDERYGAAEKPESAEASADDIEQLRDMASEAPVIRYVNAMIAEALEERASDIHLEPLEDDFQVRFRIDGILEQRNAPPGPMRAPVVSRLKLMAGLNIAERRLPQDGRIELRILGRDIDVRVATLPTLHGESVALRLLDRATSGGFSLESLGLGEHLLDRVARLAAVPHGLLLVTGPTGSGKTTTLHAALKSVNSPTRKIVTLEDPVEYRLEGVTQIHVNPAIGLTFASGLRHIVRQDPDVIMVGEIRDAETAETAVRAALTGHAVYSTLHTNDSASAITRLADMGVERYLLASSVIAVLAQRLVRLLCAHCKTPGRHATDPDGRAVRTWQAPGCKECRGQGYSGRMGIFELLEINEPLRQTVASDHSASQLADAARSQGMRTLQADGWRKIERGLTTVEEVLGATPEA